MIVSRELECAIRNAAEDNDFQIRENYSGRGMFGRECFGVVTDESVGKVIAAIIRNIDDFDVVEEFARVLEDLRTDSMGLSAIIYFPGWNLPEEVEDEDDED